MLLLNKVDRLDEEAQAKLRRLHPEARLLSARIPEDVTALHAAIVEFFAGQMVEEELTVPYARQALVSEIHETTQVLSETYDETGARLRVRALAAVAGADQGARGGVKRAAAALALTALAGTACRSRERSAGGKESATTPTSETGEPLVVAGEHAILGAMWRPDGHLLVLTPSELVAVDPDAPVSGAALAAASRAASARGAVGTVVVETSDGWESGTRRR